MAEACAQAAPELWFPVGEKITYDMKWGFLHVGTTTVSAEWETAGDATNLLIRFTTRTTRLLDKVYRVDDVVEALIDPATFLPSRFYKRLEEGSYRAEELTTFDRSNGIVRWTSLTEDRSLDYEAAPDTRDIISLMYLLRKAEFTPGETNVYVVAGDEGPAEVTVMPLQRTVLKLENHGRVDALRFKTKVSHDPLFQRKFPDEAWVSTDERRVLLRMTVDVPVGHISLQLSKVEGPGSDHWIKPASGK